MGKLLCPRCGSQMVLRDRNDGSGSFYGCTSFPTCRGTRSTPQRFIVSGGSLIGPHDDCDGMKLMYALDDSEDCGFGDDRW